MSGVESICGFSVGDRVRIRNTSRVGVIARLANRTDYQSIQIRPEIQDDCRTWYSPIDLEHCSPKPPWNEANRLETLANWFELESTKRKDWNQSTEVEDFLRELAKELPELRARLTKAERVARAAALRWNLAVGRIQAPGTAELTICEEYSSALFDWNPNWQAMKPEA